MNSSHGKTLVSALVKSVSGKYSLYLMQVVSMVVLARVFTPEQFGIFAILHVFALFFSLFSEIGLVPALVNENSVNKRMRDGVFGFTVILGVVVCVVFISVGPLVAWFYNYIDYQYLVLPIALSIIFNSCCILPTAAFVREHKFLHIARAEIISEIVSLSVVLILLKSNSFQPVFLLAVKPLVFSISKFLIIWFKSEGTVIGRAKISFEISQVRPLFRFSAYQFMSNVMVYFSRNLDNLLVGKYFGPTSLGIYDKAYQLMRYPLMLLTFAMAPAIQPVMKELNNDIEKFAHLHNKFIKYLAFIGGSVGVFLYLIADYAVLIILGEQWENVGALLKILSISVPIQIILSSSGGFFQAANRPDLLFNSTLFSFFTNVTATVVSVIVGDLHYLCWALSISFTINFLQCYYLLGKHIIVLIDFDFLFPLFFALAASLFIASLNLNFFAFKIVGVL